VKFVHALVLAAVCALPAALVCAAIPTPAQVRAAWKPSDAQLLDRDGVPLESLRIDMAARRQPWVARVDI
jgi:penicillin-binding protein 1C